jgi:hypothetical protein
MIKYAALAIVALFALTALVPEASAATVCHGVARPAGGAVLRCVHVRVHGVWVYRWQ